MLPSKLVLRPIICDYCQACKQNDTKIYDVELAHVFGIRVCTNCMQYAMSDTKAYLQQFKFLPVELIQNHIFFLKLGSTFSILRTDNTLEDNWQLNQSRIERQFVRKYMDGEYVIPVINSDGTLSKYIKLNELIKTNYKHLIEEYNQLVPYIDHLLENLTLEHVRMCVRIIQFD